MFQPQDIVTLLETAHAALREDLLKALPAEQRHTGLMVANAVALAQRYLQAGLDAGTVSNPLGNAPDMTHAALAARCRQELQIANPKRL
jgi:hypothetical protein